MVPDGLETTSLVADAVSGSRVAPVVPPRPSTGAGTGAGRALELCAQAAMVPPGGSDGSLTSRPPSPEAAKPEPEPRQMQTEPEPEDEETRMRNAFAHFDADGSGRLVSSSSWAVR